MSRWRRLERGVALTDEEKQKHSAAILAELAERHAAQAEAPTSKPVAKHTADAEREAEIARLRLELQAQFHQDNGYVRYVDSRGTERWLSPEEAERRSKRRKGKRRPVFEAQWTSRARNVGIALAIVALAVALGLALTH